ncbi:MAG: S9 family peptidase [Opitutae bacterium]|nr:S9 family peptidase [Opitutae bacterium]
MLRPLSPLFLAALCLVSAPVLRCAESTEAKSPITAADLLNLKQLESPALSPDGRWVVYVVRSIEPKAGETDDWTYRTRLWLAATDGSAAPRQLTFGAARDSSPAWSPAGDHIAFVRAVEKEKPQIHLLPLAGGEARPLTKIETGATSPRWSPDGAQILFTSSLAYAQVRAALEKKSADATPAWSNERPRRKANDTANWGLKDDKASAAAKAMADSSSGVAAGEKAGGQKPVAKPDGSLQEIREWLAKDEADANPRVSNRLNFLAEGDLAVTPEFNQFYTIAPAEGAEPQAITPGYEGYAAAAWLADGKGIVCVGPRDRKLHPDRDRLSGLYSIDVATGAAKVLLEEPGCNYTEPAASPDGKWIAYALRTGGEFSFDQPMVAVVPAGGGTPKVLTPNLDRAVSGLKWSDDGNFVYFTAPDRGGFPLFRVGVDGATPETLTAARDWGIRDYDVRHGILAQIVTNPANPWELYLGAADSKSARPLTAHNSAWLKDRQLSAYEPHRLEQADGITVDYWTIKPADFDPAKKYPLLLNIHGGPSAMWGPGEATMWLEFQFYAARGYAIVFANPRGSGGYGKDYQRANFKDWGIGPASDVLAAATFAAKEPWIDPARQVVTGGSYGGYLTAWIVGHDHRFKAAVAQRGVYDLATFYGEGNAWFLVPLYWGGYPWQPEVRAILERDSPLNYVANIRTPLLIQHGDVDFRTGVIQSQILYKSLKQLGREVEYARYPRATHELSRSGEPKQRLDTLVRYEEFFRRYVGKN